MNIKIDIKNMLKELDLENSYFISSNKVSKEQFKAFPDSENFEKVVKNEHAANLARYILNEKQSIEKIENKDDFEPIEYRTGLLVFTKEEFRKIITEIETYINTHYERKPL
jgi:hypothetical protein